jgi:hypothetical protein
MTNVVLPELMRLLSSMDLHSRHGAVTAIGEVLAGLTESMVDKNVADVLGKTFLDESVLIISMVCSNYQTRKS